MALEKYNKKRNFNSTSEPKGKMAKTGKNKIFVIQYHKARIDHFDLRLEHNGVLISFAVPKGLSQSPKSKRLAVHVEDHPYDYKDFEGVIPKGNYGAGTVEIFDKGTYIQLNNFDEGLSSGALKFFLNGKKFKGAWSLIKTDEKNWLAIKADDEYTKQTDLPTKPTKNPFSTTQPMLATLTNDIPNGKNWMFEIKYDGYRIISYIQNGKAKLLSRNGNSYTQKFSKVAESLCKFAGKIPMILDGEVVSFDESGRSDFGLLQQNIKKNNNMFYYVVFDIIAFNGNDLRNTPLFKRKDMLSKLMQNAPPEIIESSAITGKGSEAFSVAKKLGLEGIVAKEINSQYESKRSNKWLKIKCYKRQEFVIGGYCISDKNPEISAILVGCYEKETLIFVGKVGTGLSDATKAELKKKFSKSKQDKSPFSNLKQSQNATWLSPKFVCEIKYAELTKQNILRQPSFVALRDDKNPRDVKLEMI